jgi:predicted transcriptional regulator of viral defense system
MDETLPFEEDATTDLEDGVLSARHLVSKGYSRQRIQRLTKRGDLVRLGRGLYSRPDASPTERHTLALVCARVPQGVVCLLSALQFHDLTTQTPWQVWLMIDRHARTPKLDYPSLQIVRSGGEAFTVGVEEHQIEGVKVHVTGVARTIVDCFKHRHKIGLDIALEALKECLREKRTDRASLHHYARIGRVERVMQPYLDALAA